MSPTTLARCVAGGVLLGLFGLVAGANSRLEPVAATATPTPCVARRIDLNDLGRQQTLACSAADATATAYIMVGGVTATPCDPWARENVTPIPGSNDLAAPCGVVAHRATWAAVGATWTAGIIDGSYYGLHVSNSGPNWTPTVYTYGTVPAAELTAYPLTLTALPWPTPHGWHLEGDRWVVTP